MAEPWGGNGGTSPPHFCPRMVFEIRANSMRKSQGGGGVHFLNGQDITVLCTVIPFLYCSHERNAITNPSKAIYSQTEETKLVTI